MHLRASLCPRDYARFCGCCPWGRPGQNPLCKYSTLQALAKLCSHIAPGGMPCRSRVSTVQIYHLEAEPDWEEETLDFRELEVGPTCRVSAIALWTRLSLLKHPHSIRVSA